MSLCDFCGLCNSHSQLRVTIVFTDVLFACVISGFNPTYGAALNESSVLIAVLSQHDA